MIDIHLAMQLKQAGLRWQPALHDFFGVPERGMDGRVFVISEMLVNVEKVLGAPVVAFQGASEWALDYLVTSEAVWLPREDQLRSRLLEGPGRAGRLRLELEPGRCRLELEAAGGESQVFEAVSPEQAYARALLSLLEQNPPAEAEEERGPEEVWRRGLPGEQDV